ncbi:MAG: tetratricopeptide repeat protein [Fretibacterium sp.]|nr:tetratricopeptide repeat protein [Fretibacterium sp.]
MSLKKHLSVLLCAALLTALFCPPGFPAPRFLQEPEAHVGAEFVLSPDPSSIPTNAVIEWAVSGNVKPILLRAGGYECAFTPIDTSPIQVTATVRDGSGASLGTIERTLSPSEFGIDISVIPEPVLLWNPLDRKDSDSGMLPTGRPIHLRAALKPSFNGKHTFVWMADAATAILSQDAQDLLIQRSETGEAEITVKAFNAAGVLMGKGEGVISVLLPRSTFEESARSKQAWQDWQRAQALWGEKKYAEAVSLAEGAQAAAPRDPEITNGVKSMASNYARYLRGEDLRRKAGEQRSQGLYDDALKGYRLAQVVWPTPEGERTIRETERETDADRILRQKARWLRDTASAYDQEGLYEEALEYYGQALAVVSSDAIANRMERIRSRLALIADADKYAGEGSALERGGQLQEAINHYSASVMSNPDSALKQHIEELRNVVSRRQKQAARLYDEGMKLERKGSDAEALQKYRESQKMWETPGAQDRIEELEKTVVLTAPVRGPDDLGFGTRADAARLVRTGDTLYLQRRLDEAAAFYRKALAMSPDDEALRTWLGTLEAILRDQKATKAANDLFREGNRLYRGGKVQEAIAKYREGLAAHSNAEVEAFLIRNGVAIEGASKPGQSAR